MKRHQMAPQNNQSLAWVGLATKRIEYWPSPCGKFHSTHVTKHNVTTKLSSTAVQLLSSQFSAVCMASQPSKLDGLHLQLEAARLTTPRLVDIPVLYRSCCHGHLILDMFWVSCQPYWRNKSFPEFDRNSKLYSCKVLTYLQPITK